MKLLMAIMGLSLMACGPCGTCNSEKTPETRILTETGFRVERVIDRELGVACYEDRNSSRISCVLVPSLKSEWK